MIRLAIASMLVLGGCATHAAPRVLDVREIVENAGALDGKEVLVSGWMANCHPLSCGLFQSRRETGRSFPYYLSIGPSDWFDAFANHGPARQVVLRVRVNAKCISNPGTGEIAVCADRPTTLEPLGTIR